MAVYVDSDSHLMEPEAIWREYTSAKYRDQVPQVVERDGTTYMMFEGRVLPAFRLPVPGRAQRVA